MPGRPLIAERSPDERSLEIGSPEELDFDRQAIGEEAGRHQSACSMDAEKMGVFVLHNSAKLLLLGFQLWIAPGGGAFAQSATEPTQPSTIPDSPSVQGYGEHDKLCLEWTDSCVICSRSGCSNVGIACQPKQIVCSSRQATVPPAAEIPASK